MTVIAFLIIYSSGEGFFVIGGKNRNRLTSAEGVCIDDPPGVPVARVDFPLVVVDHTVYMCGGYPTTADCYTLDMDEDNSTWQSAEPLSRPMAAHLGIAVGSNIWYMITGWVYVYNTVTGSTEEFRSPLSFLTYRCAVASPTHRYAVGVGMDWDEVWVNTDAAKPSEWTMATKINSGTHSFSCVLLGETIHIQGGVDHNTADVSDTAFTLDINTYSLQKLPRMTVPRDRATATILDNKPAVVGGRNGSSQWLSSIETYNGTAWNVHEISLETARSSFGLALVPIESPVSPIPDSANSRGKISDSIPN